MSTEIEARVLREDEYDAWRTLVAASPDGSPYATPEYLAALADATGGRFHVLAALRGGSIAGGVPLYEEGRGRSVSCAPRLLLYYNGFVLREADSKYPSQRTARAIQILSVLEAALRGRGYARCEIRSRSTVTDVRPFLAGGWTARPSYSYVVDVGDVATAFARVEQNLRRLVTRCAQQGVVLTRDADFESFWRLHAQVVDRKGADLYLPQRAFARFFERLSRAGLARLYHARLPDGRSIAAQLVLAGQHPVSHTVCAGSDAAFLPMGASAFLRWKALEDLASGGWRANDLTDATLNPVTHFKSQLGGRLETSLVIEAPVSVANRARRAARGLARRAAQAARGLARRWRGRRA